MKKVFIIGIAVTSTCSWLLAVALISRLTLDRPLTQHEMLIAFLSAIVFAFIVTVALKQKITRSDSGQERDKGL